MSTPLIVVGIDDSDGARAALAWAAGQAAATGSRLRVVHAYELSLAWIDEYNENVPEWEQHAQDVAEKTLERVVQGVLDTTDVDPELHAIEGNPADVLHHEARDAALLVVGSRGRGGFTGLLLGSVGQRLAQRSPCPVVIVPLPRDDADAKI